MTKLQLNTSHLPVEMLKPLEFVTPSIPITAKQGSDVRTENLTIVFVDIAGFTATTNRQSRLQNANLLERFVRLLKPSIRQFSGHIVKSLGDALLLTFHSPTNAMLCARQLHDRLALHQQQNPELEPIVIRVAAHLGEVRLARHDVFGEAVNLASRIETVTPAGEIYLSEAVFLAMNKAEVPVTSAGQYTLDGFEHQLHLYRVEKAADASLPYGSEFMAKPLNTKPWLLAGAVALLSLMASSVWWWTANQSISAAALAQIMPSNARLLQIDWPEQAGPLTPALKLEIKQRIRSAIAPIADLYLATEASDTSAYRLRVSARLDVTRNELEIRLSLMDNQGQQQQQQRLQWPVQLAETQLQQLEATIATWFGQQQQPSSAELMSSSVFQQYLDAQFAMQQVRQSQKSQLLQQTLSSLQQLREIAPRSAKVQTLLCDAEILSAEWSLQEPNERTHQLCDAAFRQPDSLLLQARLAMLENQMPKAEQLLRQTIASNNKSMESFTLLATIYLSTQRPLDAELVLRQAIQFQPGYWPALQSIAVFYLQQGQMPQAIDYFRKVVELTPQNASTLTNLGSAYLLSGDLQSAADIYHQAVKIDPIPMVQTNLATVYYYLGRYQDALTLYQAAVRTEPSNYTYHGNLADAYRMLQQHADAKFHYEKAIRLLEPKKPSGILLAELAKYQFFVGNTDKAMEQLEDAVATAHNNPGTALIQAILLTAQRQTAAAIDASKRAIQLGYPATLLSVDPDLQPLTSYAEFRQLSQPTRNAP